MFIPVFNIRNYGRPKKWGKETTVYVGDFKYVNSILCLNAIYLTIKRELSVDLSPRQRVWTVLHESH